MPWTTDGHISVCHERVPWDAATPDHILVHGGLAAIYGTERVELYERAKHNRDVDAAWEIVREAMQEHVYDQLVDSVIDIEPLMVVIPHPAFEQGISERQDAVLGPTNAIPIVFGHYLAERLDCSVDNRISQIARVGRTALKRFQRFLWQPAFRGGVIRGTHYIIVDDVVTAGASFAALRSHIVRQGGSVCALTALAHRDGRHQPFPIRSATIDDIQALYGAGMGQVWQEAIGHGIKDLTEAEGVFLRRWGLDRRAEGVGAGDPLLYRLRNRLDKAASGRG
jgi:hypothetical protein